MALNIDAIFVGKMTFENDMRNWANFHQRMFESLKIGTLTGSFYPKKKKCELKVYRGVLCYDNEKWCKIWKAIDLPVQNWYEEFNKDWPEHSKISKICTLIGFFRTKYIMFELKKRIGEFCLLALKIDATFEGKRTCAFKNDMRNWANFHQRMFESLRIGTLMGSFYPKKKKVWA